MTGEGSRSEVRSSRFLELRTRNFELRIAPVSLESGIGNCSRSAHESCGLNRLLAGEDEYVKIVMLTRSLLRFKAGEPIDEAVGTLFRYRGEDHTVGAG